MKRLLFILIVSALLIGLAWFIPHSMFNITVQTSSDTTVSTPTAPALGEVTEPSGSTPTLEPLPTPHNIPVSFENLSFSIPEGFAYGFEGINLPAVEGPMGAAPAGIQVTLTGFPFPVEEPYFNPKVRVYPADEYTAVSDWASESLKRLKYVLANPSESFSNDRLPNVAFMGSTAQLYASQVKMLEFQNGKGVRMISAYAQFPAPIGRKGSFYHYEGLTNDGKYYVVVEIPVDLPVYSDSSNAGEFGITYPADRLVPAEMDAYYAAVTQLINDASPDGFNPILHQIDLLVQSINVTVK